MTTLYDFSNFDEANTELRRFLADQGHPHDELFWVFREDVWKRSASEVFVRYPVSPNNNVLARKVFDEGCERGLVDVHAVATVKGQVAATVWFPKFPEDEVQGWNRGMKLSIAKPLLEAKARKASSPSARMARNMTKIVLMFI